MASSSFARSLAPAAGLAAALALVPILAGDYRAYQIGLFLLYALATQGVALTWGRVGFLSLGQALFFGMGAYLSGLVLKAAAIDAAWALAWPLAMALPALIAYGIGRMLFARRTESGTYFSLITLALAMLGFQVANQWHAVTGGFNGLTDIPDLPGLDRYSRLYWVIAGVTVVATTAFAWLGRTPLGTLWTALADNEGRLQFFGFATDRLKALAFAISAFAAATGGALYAPQQGLVTPQASSVLLSTEFVVWAAVGGRSSPYGALLGAVGIGLLSSELRERFSAWEALVAIVFVVVVLRFPGGAWTALASGVDRLRRRYASPYRTRRTPPERRGQDLDLRSSWQRPSIDAPPLKTPSAPPGDDAVAAEALPLADVLRFSDVHVRANGVRILDGLDLAIQTRGIHCVIGPNGAGKTSTFNALTGRLPVSSGEIVLFGQRVRRFHPVALARLGVGRKFQVPSVFPSLSVRDNLDIALWAHRSRGADLLKASSRGWSTAVSQALEHAFPFLRAQGGKPAAQLSQGQRQMLELTMALIPEPRLLLLDEPCAGLSPEETRQQIDVAIMMVRMLRSTAIVIEHDLTAVERLAERVHVLHQGRGLRSGTLAQVQADPAVQAVYSGGRK